MMGNKTPAIEFIPFVSIFIMIAVCWFAVLKGGGTVDLLFSVPILLANLAAIRRAVRRFRGTSAP